MSHAIPLAQYVTMIEDLLANRMTAYDFSGAYFLAFQADPTMWSEDVYEPLNAVALMAEAYEPGEPTWRFDVTEEQLRDGCSERVRVLRALRSGA